MDRCSQCGHIRYEDDPARVGCHGCHDFIMTQLSKANERRDMAEAELAKYRGMEVELAAAKNDLERYTRPLTAEQAHSVMSAVVQRLGGSTCRRDADAFDAAIREVRSK